MMKANGPEGQKTFKPELVQPPLRVLSDMAEEKIGGERRMAKTKF
jgi:hypothetical protein